MKQQKQQQRWQQEKQQSRKQDKQKQQKHHDQEKQQHWKQQQQQQQEEQHQSDTDNHEQQQQKQQEPYLTNINDDQIAEFRDAFALLDQDGDGFVSGQELASAMRTFGLHPTQQQLQASMTTMDDNNNGTIDFPEFVWLLTRSLTAASASTDRDLRAAFSLLDRDASGCVGAAEVAELFSAFGESTTEAEARAIIRQADADGDGEVNFHEFVALLAGALPQQFSAQLV